MQLAYLIGQPGAGKTSLLHQVTNGLPHMVARSPFAYTIWQGEKEVPELGPRREEFSGTDGLSMSVQPKVLDWLRMEMYDECFGEGDRLATESFFRGCQAKGIDLQVIWLDTPDELAHARRLARAERLGVPTQSPSWVAGRVTKVRRLGEKYADVVLDGTQPREQLADMLRRLPVFQAFLGGTK